MSNKYRPRRWREKRTKSLSHYAMYLEGFRYAGFKTYPALPPLARGDQNGDPVARMGSFIQSDPSKRPILTSPKESKP